MTPKTEPTHAELVTRAERWLCRTLGCSVVFTEHVASTRTGEIPDAIGWARGQSHVVECKASRADFLADRRKSIRQDNFQGMGDWRFYLVVPGVIKDTDTILDGWSVYEVRGNAVVHIRGRRWGNCVQPPCTADLHSERAVLVSWLRKNIEWRSEGYAIKHKA